MWQFFIGSALNVIWKDDQRLRQRRELDSREKDPNFVSESYSECYPGYQEYNREIVDSDEDVDLTKMDVGGNGGFLYLAKGRLHRWDFETEEEWSKYNDQKEATPKAAYQFGVKMQDGRKTWQQNKDQKLNNELHKITQIMEERKRGQTSQAQLPYILDIAGAKDVALACTTNSLLILGASIIIRPFPVDKNPTCALLTFHAVKNIPLSFKNEL
ncbi:hypothetical protein SELMODRAFT_424141 [Selaginella moellendorffii]|uniref:Protein RED C-terminal domain-containing protein n=1 Tax=Selaginella moellendorffii TaxID=88036 RepID=D8SNY5_SELML|nr:hypothetical protein SELMODRAFT_424141 [Selaginella moellendorffii]